MFPEAYMLGVDLVLPDVSALVGRQQDICALVLTHGHEDHIGAIPFLLEQLGNPPIYGTGLTLGVITSYSIHYTKLYESLRSCLGSSSPAVSSASPSCPTSPAATSGPSPAR